jgi:hypothetical protein
LLSDPFKGSLITVTDDATSCQSVNPFGPLAWLPSSPAKQLKGWEQPAHAVPAPAIAKIAMTAVTTTNDKLPLLIDLERMTPPFMWLGGLVSE